MYPDFLINPWCIPPDKTEIRDKVIPNRSYLYSVIEAKLYGLGVQSGLVKIITPVKQESKLRISSLVILWPSRKKLTKELRMGLIQ